RGFLERVRRQHVRERALERKRPRQGARVHNVFHSHLRDARRDRNGLNGGKIRLVESFRHGYFFFATWYDLRIAATCPMTTLLFMSTGMRRRSSVSHTVSRPDCVNTPGPRRIGSTIMQSNSPASTFTCSRPSTFTIKG